MVHENPTTANPFVNQDHTEEQEARRARYEERSEQAAKTSEQLYGQVKAMSNIVAFGQPRVLGHHSEKKDRTFRKRINSKFDNAYEEEKKSKHYAEKAKKVGRGGIASTDPEAIRKLESQLYALTTFQERMKLTNKALRKGDDNTLKQMGFSEEKIKELKSADFAGRVGFPNYQLQNNNAEIRRVKKRIKSLQELRESEPIDFQSDDFSMSVAEGRIIVNFNGKPNEEVRTLVKHFAFKWSRYQGAWVRKVTPNALEAARDLLESLNNVDKMY